MDAHKFEMEVKLLQGTYKGLIGRVISTHTEGSKTAYCIDLGIKGLFKWIIYVYSPKDDFSQTFKIV